MFFICLICIQSYIRERTFASLLCAHSNHMRRILIDPPIRWCCVTYARARCLRSAGWGESAPAGRPAHALLHWWEILPPFSTRFGEKGPDTSWSVSLICFLSFLSQTTTCPVMRARPAVYRTPLHTLELCHTRNYWFNLDLYPNCSFSSKTQTPSKTVK